MLLEKAAHEEHASQREEGENPEGDQNNSPEREEGENPEGDQNGSPWRDKEENQWNELGTHDVNVTGEVPIRLEMMQESSVDDHGNEEHDNGSLRFDTGNNYEESQPQHGSGLGNGEFMERDLEEEEKQKVTENRQEVTENRQEVTEEMENRQEVTENRQEVTEEMESRQEVTENRQEVTEEMENRQEVTENRQEVTENRQEVIENRQEITDYTPELPPHSSSPEAVPTPLTQEQFVVDAVTKHTQHLSLIHI